LVVGPDDDPGAVARTLDSLAVQQPGRPAVALAHHGAPPLPQPAGWEDLRQAGGAETFGAALGRLLDGLDTGGAVLVGVGDRLEPDALAQLAGALAGAEVAYGDEDDDGPGGPGRPRLKPAYSAELLLGAPYLGRPLAARAGRWAALGPTAGLASEHDLMLRLCHGAEVAHVPAVLSHRATGPAPAGGERASWPAAAPGPGPVADELARRGEPGTVAAGPVPGTWRVRRPAPAGIRTSLIVCFRDAPGLLRACVDSVRATAGAVPLELVLMDNGSVEPETASLVERLGNEPGVTVLSDPGPFNWAALNNRAAAAARGDVLIFCNNDIEARRPGWLEALVAQASRPGVGAVGARLLYPDGRVQHAGVVLGLGGAAGHVFAGLEGEAPGYLGLAVLARDVAGVTGAVLATRRAVFDDLAGFDEDLGLDLNDIDYCLRARGRGLAVLYEPAAELVHHESPSRGTSGSVADITRFIDRWRERFPFGDEHLSPALTRVDSSAALRGPDEEGWWRRWHSGLTGR
jgi:GT2 family glycosyltransferase